MLSQLVMGYKYVACTGKEGKTAECGGKHRKGLHWVANPLRLGSNPQPP